MMDHPNIIRLEHYFQDSENCYFLFELCQVGDLGSFIRNHGRISSKLTREFTMELVLALEHMRKLNVVHRDIKPANILIDNTFHLKVADFGAAKQINPEEVSLEMKNKSFSLEEQASLDDDSSSSDFNDSDSEDEAEVARAVMMVRENTQIGSPLYISPEMLQYHIACFGSDLWALGVVIYQCLCGKSPFTGKNAFEIEDKINN